MRKVSNSDLKGDVTEIKVDVKDVKTDVKDVKADVKDLTNVPRRSQQSVPPTTTSEEDLRTAGQRQINLIWETTQRHIALFVILIAGLVSAYVVVFSVATGKEENALVLASFTLLSNIGFLVAGFYFGRTNHARIGDDPKALNTRMDDR